MERGQTLDEKATFNSKATESQTNSYTNAWRRGEHTLCSLPHLLQKASLDYLEIDWNVLAPDSWKGKEDDGRDMRFFKLFGMSQMMGTLA